MWWDNYIVGVRSSWDGIWEGLGGAFVPSFAHPCICSLFGKVNIINRWSKCFDQLNLHNGFWQSSWIYTRVFYFFDTIAEFTLQFLTWYFWHDVFLFLFFFDPISVNPLFVQYGVKKITASVFFCIILPEENRFDGDIFLCGLVIRTKVVIIQQVWSDNWSQL